MKNYIKINGQKIELTDDQVKEIRKSFGIADVPLSSIEQGSTFKIGKHEFIVLEQRDGETVAILKDLLFDEKKFSDTNNNYDGSHVDELCNEFGSAIAELVGEQNMVQFNLDLTSDDGLKDYGYVDRRMALLTTELYRKYVEILDNYNPGKWWWLTTANSTPKHGSTYGVRCVAPSGYVSFNYYNDNLGVRPFCILKSNIFVSQ